MWMKLTRRIVTVRRGAEECGGHRTASGASVHRQYCTILEIPSGTYFVTDAFPVAGRTGDTKPLRSCPVGYGVQTRVQKTYVLTSRVKTHNYTLFENGINLTWLVYCCCPVYQALKSKLVHTQNWENKNSCCHFSKNFLLSIL